MVDDPIEVDPVPPVDPGPGEPMTAEALNATHEGKSFYKFVEHEGGMKAAFHDAETVVFDSVGNISLEE